MVSVIGQGSSRQGQPSTFYDTLPISPTKPKVHSTQTLQWAYAYACVSGGACIFPHPRWCWRARTMVTRWPAHERSRVEVQMDASDRQASREALPPHVITSRGHSTLRRHLSREDRLAVAGNAHGTRRCVHGNPPHLLTRCRLRRVEPAARGSTSPGVLRRTKSTPLTPEGEAGMREPPCWYQC